jgi:hemerythrin-like domain-containing protein
MSENAGLTEVFIQCHRDLDDFFLLHQEAVLLGRLDAAIQSLNCFIELHDLHMGVEDQKLIPGLCELGDRGRWPAALYVAEHNKVRELIGKIEDNLLSLSKGQLSGKDFRREIITFLDTEKTLKGLCEHHQEREEAGLLRELDDAKGKRWRVSVIEPFLKEWHACMERNMNIVDGIVLL